MHKSKLILSKAKIALAQTQPPTNKKPSKLNQNLLDKALSDACSFTENIPEEGRKILEAVARIESHKSEDKFWEIRVNYLLHQLDVIKTTYPLYEEEAKRRRSLIAEVTRRNKWSEERARCKENSVYWFDNYSWTSDPRKEIGWALPFVLYDYQREAVDWLESLMFTERSSGLIEKSRDMGFSWLISSLFYKHWQHGDGSFHALIGSMTIDDSDVVGNPSSIFEKIRIQSRMQPLGLLPKGFNGDIPYCKIVNPETNGTITAEPCNERFARSGRYKVILFDELSAVTQATEALTASSQSSPCKIYNSTCRGMANEYAQIRFSGSVPVKTYHWKLHPHKDDRWYEYQKLDMNSPTRVAQELDIDYSASQPNKVYTDWDEVYHVVTKSEVMRALPSFKTETGAWQIPLGHRVVMGQDVGQVHANVLLWFLTLRQGTKTVDDVDLSGAILCYREILLPQETTPRLWAQRIKEAEGLYEPGMIFDRLISHEALTERQIYGEEYDLHFRHWTPNYNDGITRVKEYLELRHLDQPHPFRDRTRELKYKDANPITGRPTIYFVVDDEQGGLFYNESIRKFYVKPAADSGGMMRLRAEMPVYHYPTSELGKEIKRMRPHKHFDDALDNLRCVAYEHFAPIAPLNVEERLELFLPRGLQSDSIKKLPPEQQGMAFLTRQEHVREFERQEASVGLSYRDQLINKLVKK